MKKVLLCLFALFQISNFAFSQNPNRPNSILGKRLFIDHHSPKEDGFTDFDNFRGGFELGYLRNLNKYMNAVLPLKVGVIKLPEELNNRTVFGLDGVMQFQYYRDRALLTPYALAGVGGVVVEGEDIDFQIPIGLGLNIRLGKFAYVNVQSEFRSSLNLDQDNWQHGIGIGFMLGKITEEDLKDDPVVLLPKKEDQDKDGIEDKDDECPTVAGVAAFKGCPDSDMDGVKDADDECPQIKGSIATNGCPDRDKDGTPDFRDACPDVFGQVNGCPDSDGDGIVDADDRCPNEVGTKINQGCPSVDSDGDGFADDLDECPNEIGTLRGCPDSDGDGIANKNDRCPYSAGEGRFFGCPDTDGDGIDDSADKCPNMAAPSSPNGCPAVKAEDKAVLDYALQAVQFEFARDVLKSSSYSVLDQVISVMNKYPDYKLSIIGHTDNVGTEYRNQKLSVRRAKACFDYLTSKGVSPSRMNYGGFGQTKPVANNDTEEGRSQNRRVEFDLYLK